MQPGEMARLHGESFARGWSEATFAELCADPRSHLVTAPHGFALAQSVLDEAELLTIVIAPEARGQGHGRALLADLRARLRAAGIVRLFLEVAEDNTAGRALYRAAGFAETGRRKGYYPRPGGAADALLLAVAP
jgi:ribosomal-protein-alanine N-acetyltransferase